MGPQVSLTGGLCVGFPFPSFPSSFSDLSRSIWLILFCQVALAIQSLTPPHESRGYSSGTQPLLSIIADVLVSLVFSSGRSASVIKSLRSWTKEHFADFANKCVLRPRGRTWELEKRMLTHCACDYKVGCFHPMSLLFG